MKVKVRRGRVRRHLEDDGDRRTRTARTSASRSSARRAPRLLIEQLDARMAAGDLRAWVPRAFGEFARERPLHAIGTRGLPWTEIDFPEDY